MISVLNLAVGGLGIALGISAVRSASSAQGAWSLVFWGVMLFILQLIQMILVPHVMTALFMLTGPVLLTIGVALKLKNRQFVVHDAASRHMPGKPVIQTSGTVHIIFSILEALQLLVLMINQPIVDHIYSFMLDHGLSVIPEAVPVLFVILLTAAGLHFLLGLYLNSRAGSPLDAQRIARWGMALTVIHGIGALTLPKGLDNLFPGVTIPVLIWQGALVCASILLILGGTINIRASYSAVTIELGEAPMD